MDKVLVNKTLLTYMLAYLKTDHSTETAEEYDKTWKVGIIKAIQDIEQALHSNQSGSNDAGPKQIQHNPNRTDVGMGPLLNTNSDFI